MADQFNDSIPAVTNQITEDVADIAETLGFLKDCFESVCTGWSDSDASGLHVIDVQLNNDSFITTKDAAGTGTVNLIKVNASDVPEIENETLVWNSVTRTCSKTAPDGAVSVKVTGLTAGGLYEVKFSLSMSSAGTLWLRFLDDSGAAAYSWSCLSAAYESGEGTSLASDASDAQIQISDDAAGGTQFIGRILFHTTVGNTEDAVVTYDTFSFKDATNYRSTKGGGHYNGSADVTEFDIYPSTGTLTGTVVTERIA